jgi:hypothetical protein
MTEAKFRAIEIHAVTGFAWFLPNFNQTWKNPQLKACLIALLDKTELESSMLGVSDYLLAIAKKSASA